MKMAEIGNNFVFKYFRNGSVVNANGNYVVDTEFSVAPDSHESFSIARMLVQVRDTGSFDAENYGNGIDLTGGGIKVCIMRKNSIVNDLTDGLRVQTNSDWGRVCYDTDVLTWGTGDELLVVRWTFEKSGAPILLRGSHSERLSAFFLGDFSDLVSQFLMAQGLRV